MKHSTVRTMGGVVVAAVAGIGSPAWADLKVETAHCVIPLEDDACPSTPTPATGTSIHIGEIGQGEEVLLTFKVTGMTGDSSREAGVGMAVTRQGENRTEQVIATSGPGAGATQSDEFEYRIAADDSSDNTDLEDRLEAYALNYSDQEYEFKFSFTGKILNASNQEVDDTEEVIIRVTLDDVPDPVDVSGIEILDSALRVAWAPSRAAADFDLDRYRVYWGTAMPDNPVPGGIEGDHFPNQQDSASPEDEDLTLSELENGVPIYLAVTAIDEKGQESAAFGDIGIGIPNPSLGLGELARREGVDEGCFVATAAAGRDSWLVGVLSEVRDRWLKPHPWGLALVNAYYRFSPGWAGVISRHAGMRAGAYALLAPVGVVAAIALHPFGAGLLGLALLGAFLAIRRVRRGLARALPVAVLAAGWGIVPEAQAYQESPKHMFLVFKAGPYNPEAIRNFEEVYTDDPGVLFGLDAGYHLYDGYSVLSLGGGLGFYHEEGHALVQSGGEGASLGDGGELVGNEVIGASGAELDFFAMPVHASLWLDLRFYNDQPIVPFGRIGYEVIGFRESGLDTFSGFAQGFTGGGGVKLLIDLLDSSSARMLDTDYGVNNTYLTVEYVVSRSEKDDFFDFRTETVLGGLSFEF